MKPTFKPKLGLETARWAALILALPLALAAAPAGAQEALDQGGIVIKDFVLTRAIDQREPIDMVEDFTLSDEKGYAFFRVFNDGPPARMTAVWMYEGQVHAKVDLTVGTAEGWRTWSSANLKPGGWRVQLRNAGGTVLAERSFAVASEFADGSGMGRAAHDMAPAGARFDDGMTQQAEDWPELEGSAYPRFDQEEDSDG
jgi:Protein of unknown function (DUF2914)